MYRIEVTKKTDEETEIGERNKNFFRGERTILGGDDKLRNGKESLSLLTSEEIPPRGEYKGG